MKRKRVALERALSKLGYASRSQARELIQAGTVRVGVRTIRELHWQVDPDENRIAIDGVAAKRRREC